VDYADYFGSASVSVGDLDGNGVPDLAVGAPFDEGTEHFKVEDGRDWTAMPFGAVYVLFMEADGSVSRSQKISHLPESKSNFHAKLIGHNYFGMSLETTPDLDGDGIMELLVGAPGHGRAGDGAMVYIIFLRPDGTVRRHVVLDPRQLLGTTQGVSPNPFVPSPFQLQENPDKRGRKLAPRYNFHAGDQDRSFKKGVSYGDFFGASIASLGFAHDQATQNGVLVLAIGAFLESGLTKDYAFQIGHRYEYHALLDTINEETSRKGAIHFFAVDVSSILQNLTISNYFRLDQQKDPYDEQVLLERQKDRFECPPSEFDYECRKGGRDRWDYLSNVKCGVTHESAKIRQRNSFPSGSRDGLGRSLAYIGDLDGDGKPDLAAGTLSNGGKDEAERGSVIIFFSVGFEEDVCNCPRYLIFDNFLSLSNRL
jgi:hypothetical protein